MKFTKSFVICSIGFFALASQTLLFRQFLVSFEGNELGIGTFFGSWFVWIGIGAVVASRTGSWIRPFANRVEFVSLLYLPAFFVQHILIAHARQIMGIDPYEYFGFGAMIATSLLVNAPVSFMTGILFPLACQWVESSGDMPVSRVYLWESAGSCLGGLAVTLALWQEISWPIIFFLSATLLSLSTASARWVKRKLWLPVLLLSGFLLAAVPLGIAKRWSESNVQRKWQRLIPQATYQGAFQTPQEYIYGNYQEDQFLVTSSGQVVETYPDRESAGRIAALHLAENPNELVTRFKGIEGSERIFPAEALETLFPKNRVAFARRIYESSDLPSDSLLNTDECPLAHLYSLLLLGRHTHYPFTRLIKRISLAGIWFFSAANWCTYRSSDCLCLAKSSFSRNICQYVQQSIFGFYDGAGQYRQRNCADVSIPNPLWIAVLVCRSDRRPLHVGSCYRGGGKPMAHIHPHINLANNSPWYGCPTLHSSFIRNL